MPPLIVSDEGPTNSKGNIVISHHKKTLFLCFFSRTPVDGKYEYQTDASINTGEIERNSIQFVASIQACRESKSKMIGDFWTPFGSSIATIFIFWSMYQNQFPNKLRDLIKRHTTKLTSYFYPYIEYTFPEFEFEGNSFCERSKQFCAIEQYLSTKASIQAKRLKVRVFKESEALVLSMGEHEQVTDSFENTKVWWASTLQISKKQSFSIFPSDDDKRAFTLTFHEKDGEVVKERYLKYVLNEGKEIEVRQRQRKLFTNNKTEGPQRGSRAGLWSHVLFDHPASFQTLAMKKERKELIQDELEHFKESRGYYRKIGKAWKRGYLLYGPPGTGKSTMIASMANLLEYDVYDLELTAVKDNTELRRLLIDTTSKSIVVIEDIDCSLDLTGQRQKKNKRDNEKEDSGETKNGTVKDKIENVLEKDQQNNSQVTLSGLLNCIDGLWSTCGEERIFVFTTNYIEKLDPALIRTGRMDSHIELSYCCFESFKVLAKNYWDLEFHDLFPAIEKLLGETKMTPADVAENLMKRSRKDDANSCLERLIKSIDIVKEEARLKAEEEMQQEAEEGVRLTAEKAKEEIESL